MNLKKTKIIFIRIVNLDHLPYLSSFASSWALLSRLHRHPFQLFHHLGWQQQLVRRYHDHCR